MSKFQCFVTNNPVGSLLLSSLFSFASPPHSVHLTLELSKKRWRNCRSCGRSEDAFLVMDCHRCILAATKFSCLCNLSMFHFHLVIPRPCWSHSFLLNRTFFLFSSISHLFLIYSFLFFFSILSSPLFFSLRAASGLGEFGSHWWATFLHDKQLTRLFHCFLRVEWARKHNNVKVKGCKRTALMCC